MSYAMHSNGTKLHAVVAEFGSPDTLLDAAKAARQAGFNHLEAYSPFPIHGLSEAIGFKDSRIPWIFFVMGLIGAFAGFSLLYYVSVFDYPLNVGGKPLDPLPDFIPITFECMVLIASISGFLGMLGLNGLPRPHHPIFDTPNFERATGDRFFLALENTGSLNESAAMQFLQSLEPINVSSIAEEIDEEGH